MKKAILVVRETEIHIGSEGLRVVKTNAPEADLLLQKLRTLEKEGVRVRITVSSIKTITPKT